MPNPRSLSIPKQLPFSSISGRNWLGLARSEGEFLNTVKLLQGIPSNWIDWVDKQVLSRKNSGVSVTNELNYRLSILWQGIVLLQENKYILDMVENSLRQAFVTFSNENQLRIRDIRKISNRTKMIERYNKQNQTLDENSLFQIEFVSQFMFGDLIKTYIINWNEIASLTPKRTGYGTLFWNKSHCRDKNYFEWEMEVLRKHRNAIAHSNRLFTPEDTREIYRTAIVWLDLLGNDLRQKVLTYRNQRPTFLNGVIYPEVKNGKGIKTKE